MRFLASWSRFVLAVVNFKVGRGGKNDGFAIGSSGGDGYVDYLSYQKIFKVTFINGKDPLEL